MCTYITLASRLHGTEIEVQTKKFEFLQVFQSWEEEEEFHTKSQHIKKCAQRPCLNGSTHYFYCNRAGTYVPRGEHCRQLKSQGTAKLGEQCTAHIKAIVENLTGEVVVEYCATYRNHNVKMSHLKYQVM